MLYPDTISSSDKLFSLSFRYAWYALRQIFFLILIFVVLKSLDTHAPQLPKLLERGISLLIGLIAIYLLTAAFLRVDGMLRGVPLTLQQALVQTLQCIGKVFLACLLIVVVCLVIFFLGRWVILSVFGLREAFAGVAALLLIGIPMILILIFFYFTIPLLAVHKQPLLAAFYHSPQYTRQRLFCSVLLYIEMVIILGFSLAHTRHGQWLLSHHLMELGDLVVFSLVLPPLINLTLLLLNDVQLKSPR